MDPSNSHGSGRNLRRYRGTPRWVKVFAIVGAVLLLALVVLHITGHGFGGHSMHGLH